MTERDHTFAMRRRVSMSPTSQGGRGDERGEEGEGEERGAPRISNGVPAAKERREAAVQELVRKDGGGDVNVPDRVVSGGHSEDRRH